MLAWLVTTQTSRIQVFDKNGYFRQSFGQDQLERPMNLSIANERLYVPDYFKDVVPVFSIDGRYLTAIVSEEAFNSPAGASAFADGYNDRVQQFNADGEYVRKWGGPFGLNIYSPFKGWFATVTSIAVGPEGNVFVADFYNDRIQKFTSDGDYLTSFGNASDKPGQTEIAVAVDGEGTVWTANFADNQIEKWRPE